MKRHCDRRFSACKFNEIEVKQKMLCHGNSFLARVRGRYFCDSQKYACVRRLLIV